MNLFKFFQKKPAQKDIKPVEPNFDKSNCTGKDFEFLITGDIEIPNEDFDEIMTPNSFEWTKIIKNGCQYYQIEQDEFSYSIEPPGIQMVFNKEVTFQKAKAIADEVVLDIKATGQNPELVILSTNQIYRFD